MYGVEVLRLKRRLSRKNAAEITGMSVGTLERIEDMLPESTSIHFYQRLARLYGVRVDALLVECSDAAVVDGDHPPTVSQHESEQNCLTWYRRRNNLTYREMAQHMGITSAEGARINCRRETPRDIYVMRLAIREGITEDEFRMKYRKASLCNLL